MEGFIVGHPSCQKAAKELREADKALERPLSESKEEGGRVLGKEQSQATLLSCQS